MKVTWGSGLFPTSRPTISLRDPVLTSLSDWTMRGPGLGAGYGKQEKQRPLLHFGTWGTGGSRASALGKWCRAPWFQGVETVYLSLCGPEPQGQGGCHLRLSLVAPS